MGDSRSARARINRTRDARIGGETITPPHDPRNRGALTAIDGAMALIVLLLIVQMWLLAATLDDHREAAMRFALLTGLEARLASDAARRIDVNS